MFINKIKISQNSHKKSLPNSVCVTSFNHTNLLPFYEYFSYGIDKVGGITTRLLIFGFNIHRPKLIVKKQHYNHQLCQNN